MDLYIRDADKDWESEVIRITEDEYRLVAFPATRERPNCLKPHYKVCETDVATLVYCETAAEELVPIFADLITSAKFDEYPPMDENLRLAAEYVIRHNDLLEKDCIVVLPGGHIENTDPKWQFVRDSTEVSEFAAKVGDHNTRIIHPRGKN